MLVILLPNQFSPTSPTKITEFGVLLLQGFEIVKRLSTFGAETQQNFLDLRNNVTSFINITQANLLSTLRVSVRKTSRRWLMLALSLVLLIFIVSRFAKSQQP